MHSFGEDCMLNSFEMKESGEMKLAKGRAVKKLPGIVFSIFGQSYFTCYEQMSFNVV